MANALQSLLALSDAEKEKLGVKATPREIFQQPGTWRKTLAIVQSQKEEIKQFLANGKDRQIILSGAGTSEFVGWSLINLFNKVSGFDTKSIPTTGIITDPSAAFRKGGKYFLVHFARSGNSPESVGTFIAGVESEADVKHIVITCNKDGKLAQMGREIKDKTLMIVLPEETNDESLVMTSSFSSMVVAGICVATINDLDKTASIIEKIAKAGEVIMEKYPDGLKTIGESAYTRAVFLGSNTLAGCATECHLKLQEMTSGKVVAKNDSFLGLRHGPQAVIDDKTLVVYLLSEDSFTRRYEMDLVLENDKKKIGMKKVAICSKSDAELNSLCDLVIEHGCDIPDDYQTPAYVIVGQLLGLYKSMGCGLKPDAPSATGIINRVVQGVKIYDRPLYGKTKEFKVVAGN